MPPNPRTPEPPAIAFITALGPKGGSAVAAAVINALAIMALEEIPS